MKETMLQLFKQILGAPYIQLEENAASYYVQRDGETLYLLFEASNGATDWKNNFDFPAKPYKEMKTLWFVHRGFLRVWKTIEPHVAESVADPSVKKIVVGGYSHGAAIAVLCHEYCVFHRPDIADKIEGYGFGCPRVIWGPLKKNMKARFENFTVIRNDTDIVTHLPPCLFFFRHVGQILHVGKGKKYGIFGSHYPDKYIAELEIMERVHGK